MVDWSWREKEKEDTPTTGVGILKLHCLWKVVTRNFDREKGLEMPEYKGLDSSILCDLGFCQSKFHC